MKENAPNEAHRYLYSVAAAARMFACPSSHVLGLKVWDKVIWLYLKGQRPFFVSKEAFKTHFVLWRRVNGKRLREAGLIRQDSQDSYSVMSQRSERFHTVEMGDRTLLCTCGDFQKQQELFGQACCKHAYGVLQMRGYARLQDFAA